MSRGQRTVGHVVGFKLPLPDDAALRAWAVRAGLSPGALARTVVTACLRGRQADIAPPGPLTTTYDVPLPLGLESDSQTAPDRDSETADRGDETSPGPADAGDVTPDGCDETPDGCDETPPLAE